MPDVYISSICCELGAPLSLESLGEPGVDALSAVLHAEGIRTVRVSHEPSWRLAARAAAGTLQALGGGRPEATLYSSEDVESAPAAVALSRLVTELDLLRSPAIAVGGHGCGNFGPAVRTAAALLRAEGWSSVLLAVADRAGSKRRLRQASLTVLSDGAATCLVGTQPIGPSFRLAAVATAASQAVEVGGPDFAAARETLRGVRDAVESVCRSLAWTRADFAHVVLHNYGATARQLMAMAAGVDASRVVASDVSDTGHCFSADPLLNLWRALGEGIFAPGDRVLLVSNGASSWSAIAVEYVEP